ncbi:MAG TPA: alpha-amylase C-terminal beta-sheet domain-containing protein [Spirochaetota bacterium]|nr:alpha-amylase C-terminal beta-sheet domain-containing protein [Spirochaetota bacterium]
MKKSESFFIKFFVFFILFSFACSNVNLVNNVKVEENKDSLSSKREAGYSGDGTDVLLQAFHWNSVVDYKNNWYAQISAKKDDIKDTFGYVWFPPPTNAGDGPRSGVQEGYVPRELNNLTSQYGTETALRQAIADISPSKAIADVVVNHRTGSTSWADFRNPQWTADYYSICSDDECFTNPASPVYGYTNKGANDTGEKYAAFRDIDHTNTSVQSGIVDWMTNKLKACGFVGWRYDFVKGFDGQYVGKYSQQTGAVFSVGEYWPSSGFYGNASGWKNEIVNWINRTALNGGMKSKAFDFVLKGNMNYAFGYQVPANNEYQNNLWDLSRLADSNNLMRSIPDYAVTFVDNHDTGSTQQHWELDPYDVYLGYVFILTHPGVPSVAWQHYFTGSGSQFRGGETAPGTGKSYHDHIKYLITLRKQQGIKYNSSLQILASTWSNYAAKINGNTIVKIGGDSWNPTNVGETGWGNPVYSGTNFAIWIKSPTTTTTTTTVASGWVRTVVFMYKETVTGQDIFIKGGHDAGLVPSVYPAMSEPIIYNNTKNPTTASIKANDAALDWGSESSLDWTTNYWPPEWGAKKTYANDGYGEDPENQWGHHWWKFDVMMTGAKGDWFEFKAFMRQGTSEWWESDRSQSGTPYSTINHWGRKGYRTRVIYNDNWVELTPLP